MNMGIITAWKRGLKLHILREIALNIETKAKRHRTNSVMRPGLRGMREGYDPHMFSVATTANQAWENVS